MVRLKEKSIREKRATSTGFNSKMVRLKVCRFPIRRFVCCCFNSKMVRLKACGKLPHAKRVVEFQFQNGSIKSPDRLYRAPNSNSFNSKMVRLKGGKLNPTWVEWLSFNSKMVRLKEYPGAGSGRIGIVSIPKWFD